jgi:radical SAM protein with 4Fe4S-binding SPASM domain
LDPEYPNWISANEPGAQIIEELGHSTLEDIALNVSRRWGINFDEALKECRVFIEELKDKEFISEGIKPRSKYPGRSKVIDCSRLQELWIYTNNSCNLRCSHCFVSAGDVSKSEMTTSEIKALVDEAMALGAFRFYFTGGEPFLRKDIFDLIEYILGTDGNELIVLSNGTLFKGELLKKLKKFRKRNITIQVSLDGSNSKVNDSIRGKGSFENAVEGIKTLVSIGMAPIVTTTITKHNVDHLKEMPRLLASLGVKNHHILWLQNSGRAKKNPEGLTVSPEKITKVMRDLIGMSKKFGIIVDNEMSLLVRTKTKRGRKHDLCNSCYEMLSVDSDGHVYPCAPLNGEKEFDCGSIKKQSLKDIWLNSKKTQAVRDNNVSIKEGCKVCNLRFICGGGCFCQSYYASKAEGEGVISAKDPYCSALQNLTYDLLWELATPEDYIEENNGYQAPKVLASMDSMLPSCSVPSTMVTDFSFEIGTFHCSCVLAVDLEGDEKIGSGNGNRLAREACFNERSHEYLEWLESPIGEAYNSLAKKKVFSLLNIKQKDCILEIGCGTGNYALEFARRGGDVIGVDASEWMLRIAKKNVLEEELDIDLKHCFVGDLEFKDESFDVVFSMNMLEYSRNPKDAVEEMYRVLKRGGVLIIGVLNKSSLWGVTRTVKKRVGKEAYHGARFLTRGELLGILPSKNSHKSQLSTTVFFPPINNKYLLGAQQIFEWFGGKILPRYGALTILKFVKGE